MSFSLVPGFAQRYPKDDDPDTQAGVIPDPSRHDLPGPDRASLLLETCCTTLEQASAAQSRGAGRIELCTDLSVGGLTPPRDLIREVVASLTIPVNVLIRPVVPGCSLQGRRAPRDPSQASLGPSLLQCRGWHGPWREHPETTGTDIRGGFSLADFVYDEAALQQMMDDIAFCKSVGAAGIVVGALTPDGTIDLPAMRQLIAAAHPLPVTFHRAFDVCTSDPFIALDQLISLGCARLLTSGQAPKAWEGRALIALLVRRAGRRLTVMPGSGITAANLSDLAAVTNAREFHGTRIP